MNFESYKYRATSEKYQLQTIRGKSSRIVSIKRGYWDSVSIYWIINATSFKYFRSYIHLSIAYMWQSPNEVSTWELVVPKVCLFTTQWSVVFLGAGI